MKKGLMNYIGALLVLGFSHNILADKLTVTVSDAFIFNTDTAVIGATILTRRNNEVRIDVSTTGLTAYGAYSVWWVVFNNPDSCTHGTFGNRCGLGDLPAFGGDPNVDASLVWAGGAVTTSGGALNMSAVLRRNKPPGQVVMGNPKGLKDVFGADIHVALRSHPAMAGTIAAGIGSFNGGCPGGAGCANAQASVHESESNDDDD